MVKVSLVVMSVLALQPFIVTIVEDVSLFSFTSPTTPTEEEGNKDQDEGFTRPTNPLPVNLEKTDNPHVDSADTKVPEMDPGLIPLSTDNLNQTADKISGREKRAPKFKPGPNGDLCILSDTSADSTYEFTDPSTDRHCQCDLCENGKIVKRDCTCNQDPQDNRQTECELVRPGQIMQARNKCKLAYNCTVCNYPWIVDEHEKCKPAGPDTTCTCGPDGYLVTRNDCRPVPRCSKDHEPISGGGEHGTEMRCSPCKEGYHQPESNTTNKCRRIDPEERGTATLDAPKSSTTSEDSTAGKSPPKSTSKATKKKTRTTEGGATTLAPTTDETTSPTGSPPIICLTWNIVVPVIVACFVIGLLVGACIHKYLCKQSTSVHRDLPREAETLPLNEVKIDDGNNADSGNDSGILSGDKGTDDDGEITSTLLTDMSADKDQGSSVRKRDGTQNPRNGGD
ncbi:uncharacterized protein LOC110979048 [Acanthaster planci]|uniref:Uncharacterized protein LOC110979048 n=1 Tax=Acanthaster planci TaxID=133434 RepID=A0A8B7YCV3_ACAPL|nr:uncharacterized protein LOC110979048 [Acanthaster planci]